MVFNDFLKVVKLLIERKTGGRLFQARGPATANARLPNCVFVVGSRRSPCVAERNRLRAAISMFRLHSDEMYAGAEPFKALNIVSVSRIHIQPVAVKLVDLI